MFRARRWDFDETFGYDHGWVVGETGVVCDWSGVEEGSNDMPKCVKGVCGGHKEHDVLPFIVKVKDDGYYSSTNSGATEKRRVGVLAICLYRGDERVVSRARARRRGTPRPLGRAHRTAEVPDPVGTVLWKDLTASRGIAA